MTKPPKGTMTAGKAWKIAVDKHKITISGDWFAMIGWKSPETGEISGPFLVTRSGNQVIEVDRNGKYVESYPHNADCYFPWIGG